MTLAVAGEVAERALLSRLVETPEPSSSETSLDYLLASYNRYGHLDQNKSDGSKQFHSIEVECQSLLTLAA